MLLGGKRLNGDQGKLFRDALSKAFTLSSFDRMLRDNLDKKVEDIIIPTRMGFPDVLDEVIERAELESWTAQLLQATLSERHEDVQLIKFAQLFGPVISTPPLKDLIPKYHSSFEHTVNQHAPMYDLERLVQQLYELAGQICRIEDANEMHLGTGFLVGPDIIMTNYHVWEAAKHSDNFICRFDHTSESESVYYLTAQKYEIFVSKYNPEEGQPNDEEVLPASDELDFVLLRLAKAPGNNFIRHHHHQHTTKRGWITPYLQTYKFQPDTPLFILHYPQTSSFEPITLKISLESRAITGLNGNETRVKYATNTGKGSSGAPCFNADWKLVALHHAGDPNYKETRLPEYNQGIPFRAIQNLLKKHGKQHVFAHDNSLDENISHTPKAEDVKPLPKQYNNEMSSVKEQHHIISLEANVLAHSTDQHEIEDEVSIDEDENISSKVINFSTRKKQREIPETVSNQSFIEKTHQYLQDTQRLVEEAYKPLVNNLRPTPKQFRETARLLSIAKQCIQSLRDLLFKDFPIPEDVLENHTSINNYINAVIEQIEVYLTPSLNWNQVEDFSPLRQALQEIETLLSEKKEI